MRAGVAGWKSQAELDLESSGLQYTTCNQRGDKCRTQGRCKTYRHGEAIRIRDCGRQPSRDEHSVSHSTAEVALLYSYSSTHALKLPEHPPTTTTGRSMSKGHLGTSANCLFGRHAAFSQPRNFDPTEPHHRGTITLEIPPDDTHEFVLHP